MPIQSLMELVVTLSGGKPVQIKRKHAPKVASPKKQVQGGRVTKPKKERPKKQKKHKKNKAPKSPTPGQSVRRKATPDEVANLVLAVKGGKM